MLVSQEHNFFFFSKQWHFNQKICDIYSYKIIYKACLYDPLTINVQFRPELDSVQVSFFFFPLLKSNTNTKHMTFLEKSWILHYLQNPTKSVWEKILVLSPLAVLIMNSVANTCELLWKMSVCVCRCKRPWPHTLKGNKFNTDGIDRLHSWTQTHLDLTITLYTTSLPTTLNWALHSHHFHPMQILQNTGRKWPFPTLPIPPPPNSQFGLHFLPPSPNQHKEMFSEIHNIQYV